MEFIKTYQGVRFSPLAPKEEHIRIGDIAHALSLMTRANGHFETFFSVAQHCLNCAREAAVRQYPGRVQLACLLHDASEAYISDLTRPVKHYLAEYEKIERKLQETIYAALGPGSLTPEEKRALYEVDDAMLYYEFFHFTGDKVFPDPPPPPADPDFSWRPFKVVEMDFLETYERLAGRIRT